MVESAEWWSLLIIDRRRRQVFLAELCAGKYGLPSIGAKPSIRLMIFDGSAQPHQPYGFRDTFQHASEWCCPGLEPRDDEPSTHVMVDAKARASTLVTILHLEYSLASLLVGSTADWRGRWRKWNRNGCWNL